MSDFLTNAWIVNIITGIISCFIYYAISRIFKFFVNIKHHVSKKGVIGKFFRNSSVHELWKVKAIRRDAVLVSREISQCHTYQAIFWISMMIYFWLIIALTILSEDFRAYITQNRLTYNISAVMLALPVYIFEFLYLIKRDFIKTLLKYRK